jgi:hypothetical protein
VATGLGLSRSRLSVLVVVGTAWVWLEEGGGGGAKRVFVVGATVRTELVPRIHIGVVSAKCAKNMEETKFSKRERLYRVC